ncbi:MAG: class I SAM-dependent methyltransferase, partial [Nocardioidaceae bacterium]
MVEHRGAIRATVWDTLRVVLQSGHQEVGSIRPLQIVDLGGGTGWLAVRVAELGHHVTVVDPSPDALASLARRAAEADVRTAVRGVQGDAVTLRDLVEPGSADVVICHGVLEVVDDPVQALAAAAAVLVEHGHLSVLAAQRSAAVISRALAGHPIEAHALLDQLDGGPGSADSVPRRFSRARLEELVESAGLTVAEVRGVRVFTDH